MLIIRVVLTNQLPVVFWILWPAMVLRFTSPVALFAYQVSRVKCFAIPILSQFGNGSFFAKKRMHLRTIQVSCLGLFKRLPAIIDLAIKIQLAGVPVVD